MALILSITNVDRLENGVATRLRLDRHGAVIGRSPHVDWSLPDPKNHISSTHCEIDYRDGGYTLIDTSTNGTYLNGGARMAGPHLIEDGDVILIGHYQISAALEGAAREAPEPAAPAWAGWDSHAGAPAANVSGWDRPTAEPAISGVGPMSQSWAAPLAATDPSPSSSSSIWATPAPSPTPASDWSSPANSGPATSSASDVWGRLEAGNVVDWARGFSAPRSMPDSPAADPLGLGPAPAADPLGLRQRPVADPFGLGAPQAGGTIGPASNAATSAGRFEWGSPATATAAVSAHASAPSGREFAAFLAATGLAETDLKQAPSEVMAAAGAALRRLVGGVVVMLEARARAKAQLGAQGTALELEGNNALKFARTPEQALMQLLNPPQRGFMPSDRAVETAFQDLQAHQMATLAAMQGALQATLARFSPESIRNRAETRGLMEKILPGAREATLWKAYEREFEGVARGSAEAFMDVFAKEFKEAYERTAAEMKRR